MDSGFAAKENFEFIVQKKKHFIAALKDNRLFALSEKDKKEGRFVRVDTLQLTDKQAVRGWLKGFGDEVLLVRQVFPPPRAKPARWGINKQGRQHGNIESGVQRSDARWRARRYDLQETVESGGKTAPAFFTLPPSLAVGGVSQIVEVQCGLGEVANTYGHHPEQSRVHVDLRRVQAGVPETKTQTEPLRLACEALYQSNPAGLSRALGAAGCVTSANKSYSISC